MNHVKKMLVMAALDVGASIADEVVTILERAGITEDTVTVREFVAACGAAYADLRERSVQIAGDRAAG